MKKWQDRVGMIDVSAWELFKFADQLKKDWPQESLQGAPWGWVLDLDSTVFEVGVRTQQIFRSYIAQLSSPNSLQMLVFRSPSQVKKYYVEDWIEDVLSSHGVPEARLRAVELWKDFETYWYENFFSSRAVWNDRLTPGVRDFVNEIYKRQENVIFLTGRDHRRMGLGTLQVLRHHGLWEVGLSRLMMKSFSQEPDLQFKDRTIGLLRAQYRLLGAIDNEPELIHLFSKRLPLTPVVWIETTQSHRTPPQSDNEVSQRYFRIQNFLR